MNWEKRDVDHWFELEQKRANLRLRASRIQEAIDDTYSTAEQYELFLMLEDVQDEIDQITQELGYE